MMGLRPDSEFEGFADGGFSGRDLGFSTSLGFYSGFDRSSLSYLPTQFLGIFVA